jgi:hypothetical protein
VKAEAARQMQPKGLMTLVQKKLTLLAGIGRLIMAVYYQYKTV